MPILAENNRQFTYIYNSNTSLGKVALANLESTEYEIKSIDISKETISDSIWVEIADKLNLTVGELCIQVDTNNKLSDKNADSFSSNDWIKKLNNTPDLLQKPILLSKDKSMIISNKNDTLKFFSVDSAGLKKTMHTEKQVNSPTTEGEKFV